MARYRIEGMTCDGCARAVQRAAESQAPGRTIRVDRGAGTLEIEGDGVDEARLRAALGDAGFALGGPA
ncbi:MAG: heavy-metal-associated domain-containing protein [Rhodospirillales bacterium]|jgi:copper chaperone